VLGRVFSYYNKTQTKGTLNSASKSGKERLYPDESAAAANNDAKGNSATVKHPYLSTFFYVVEAVTAVTKNLRELQE
jgi:hypothetical protein